MIERFRYAAFVACALALTGCGLTSSPADNLTFKAPEGWSASPGIMGFMQFWKPANADNQVLMLFKSPKPLDSKEVLSNAKLKDAKMQDEQRITICGNQPAMYYKGEATSTNNGSTSKSDIEMVMSNAGGNTYFSMYVYPIGSKPDPQAEDALKELCAKP